MQNRLLQQISALLIFSSIISNSHADWFYSGYLAHNRFNHNKAQAEGIDDQAPGIGFTAEQLTGHSISMSMGAEFIIYDDQQSFSQTVQFFNSNNTRSERSTANAVLLFFDIGPYFRLGENQASYFAIKGGFSTNLYSERSISYCGDCYSEDIDIEGGLYIQSSLAHNFDKVSFGLHLIQYIGNDSDIENSLRFTIGSKF